MSQLLLSDLLALSTEAKRKNVDVRNASDAALSDIRNNSQSLLEAKGERAIQIEKNILLQPIILACQGKSSTPKVVGIAVGLLQRVIALHIIHDNDIATIIDLLDHVVSTRNDIEVQLKVLQSISSLLSNYTSIHDQILSKTLSLCFPLQSSRIAVVSSTASATLRQAVMTIFDKVKEEDTILDGIKSGGEDAAAVAPLAAMNVQLIGNETVTLFPCSKDAYLVMTDLNALASDENATFLQIELAPKTFTLELIESILTNHAHLFKNDSHPELLLCLRQATCPLLIKALNRKPTFTVTLRLVRLLFVLLRQFNLQLKVEVEILLSILIKFVGNSKKTSRDSNEKQSPSIEILPWQRILALEAIRSLVSDGILMRNIWKWFDSTSESISLLTKFIDSLHSVATEDRSLIGSAEEIHQMSQDITQDSKNSLSRRQSGGILHAAAGVANAIGGLSSVSDVSKVTNAGLNSSSFPTIQLIDQLDKTEAPSVPITYSHLLALQSLVQFTHSLASYALPVYSHFVNARKSSAPRAPPILDFNSLSDDDRKEMQVISEIVQQTWAPLLDTFTFYLASKSDDYIFAEVLVAFRNFTNTAGSLGLISTRQAFIASLSRYAIPPPVLQKLTSMRNRPSAADEIDVSLSERNAACLKSVTQIAYYLSGSIGTHWRDILEILCDAEYVLRRSVKRRDSMDGDSNAATSPTQESYKFRPNLTSIPSLSTVPTTFTGSATDAVSGRPVALSQLDNKSLLNDISRVFENSIALGETAFFSFLQALCELDADHCGIQSVSKESNSVNSFNLNRSSPLSSLATVCMLNIKRIAESNISDGAWQLVTNHMLKICSSSNLKPSLRMQAALAIDAMMLSALQETSTDHASQVQERVFGVLLIQCVLNNARRLAADIEIRKAGLDCLSSVVENHGSELRLGWEIIFKIFDAACATPKTPEDRSSISLVKTAFACMQTICSNLLAKLNKSQIKLCIQTLTQFGSQKEDINIALTAGGALWGITAELSSRTEAIRSIGAIDDATDLWIQVLKNAKILTNDERLQVRNGAISLLFSILEQYGSILSQDVWQESVMGDILLPLIESLEEQSINSSNEEYAKEWNESRVLALSSTGKVIRQVLLEKIAKDFDGVWSRLLNKLGYTYLAGPSNISQAAIRAMQNVLHATIPKDHIDFIIQAWQVAWRSWCSIGEALLESQRPFTQANLLAFVETLLPLHSLLEARLSFEQVDNMLKVLKTVMTYSLGSERVSDADRMSALQMAIISIIRKVESNTKVAPRVLLDLAEYSRLAIDVGDSSRTTFIALNRASTEMISQILEQQKFNRIMYENGAIEKIFSAFSSILHLRYKCPGNRDDPFWKGTMIAFCKGIKLCCEEMNNLSLNDKTLASIWTSMTNSISSALTANMSALLDMTIERQRIEEVFDLILLTTIEQSIWPQIGGEKVPSSCIIELSKSIAAVSLLNNEQRESFQNERWNVDEQMDDKTFKVKKEPQFIEEARVPREIFSYWCLEFLMLVCSSTDEILDASRLKSLKRSAALSLPALVQRINSTFRSYIEEIRVRGNVPIGRIQEEEVNFILSKLEKMQIWKGSFAIALANSKNDAAFQSYLDGNLEKISLNEKEVSPFSLLFHIYPFLCQLLLIVVPRQGGRFGTMKQATCGSSKSIGLHELPPGFQLMNIGRAKDDNSGFIIGYALPQLADCRELSYSILAKIGQNW